ncbi:MAG: hypothetical protein ACREN3_10055, partial [Gemmatimonadaceae bacterium]
MHLSVRAASIAALGLALFAAPGRAQQTANRAPKIVYVNTQALLDVAPGRAVAESTYKQETTGWGDELNKMSADIQTMITDYQKA